MSSGYKWLSLLTVCVSVFQFGNSVKECAADDINVLVPAYANPCCDDGPAMWSQLIATAGDPTRNFDLHVILNPASGPGTTREANYLDASGSGPLASVRSAGALVHGYVPTGFGTRDIALVKSDNDQYLVNTALYGGFVDGIFFDEMSNDLADVGYYQEIAAYVEMQSAGAHTFGNPGTSFVNNPSGQTEFTASNFGSVFDTMMSFENTGDEYRDNYTDPVYLSERPASGFAHAIHTESVWDPAVLTLAQERQAGFLYVTDDVFLNASTDNPWDSLSSYWPQFSSDLSQFNAVPEPSSAIVLLCVAAGVGLRRRRV